MRNLEVIVYFLLTVAPAAVYCHTADVHLVLFHLAKYLRYLPCSL